MKVVGTFAAVRDLAAGVIGLVPTMGFLHEGHLALVDTARRECDTVVMSLFVNPLQFDETRDLSRYPRDSGRDAHLAAEQGVDVLFAPELEEMYPRPQLTRVRVSDVTEGLEGPLRPGHFEGVATVVAKLFIGTGADRAYFGRKDAQQLVTVTRMAFDLSMPVEVVPVPIVREPDGLALSSRNVFLSPEERDRASGISAGLMAAAGAAEDGERSAEELETMVAGHLGDLEVDYVTLADADSAQPVRRLEQDSFLAVAARVGNTRLIDNVFFRVTSAGIEADRGHRLEGPSILYEGR
ncbi:MAG: pantoate--beta-alanine ligase [Acidimicrobiia bacterium]|nr:pantoate--beta-alanine ligase [Acidimicrobiia bacterium]